MEMEWENVIFKEPELTVIDNYIYFNSALRDSIGQVNGIDLFKAVENGKEILSFKAGKQFLFSKKKNEYRIVCQNLANYIKTIYGTETHFKLILDDNYWILRPKMII